jgi:hypothetical protein
LAFSDMKIDNTYHSHPLGLIAVSTTRKVGHFVNLDKCVDVSAKLLYVSLH